MSGRVTSTPKAEHHCNAGWRVETDEELAAREALAADPSNDYLGLPAGCPRLIEDPAWPEAGTIWTCDDCGREWKATFPYLNVFAPTWVRHHPIKPIRWPWKRSKEAK